MILSLLLTVVTYFLAKSNSTSFIPTYIIFLGIVVQLFSQRMKPILRANSVHLIVICTFLAYMLMNNLWNTSLAATLKPIGYVLLILSFLICIPFIFAQYKGFFILFIRTLLISASISATFSLWAYFELDYRTEDHERLIAFGGLDNPVMSGLSYGAVCILGFAHIVHRPLFERALVSIGLLIILTALLLTETRSALLGLIFSATALIIVYKERLPLQQFYVLTKSLVIILLAALLAYYAGYLDALLERSTSLRPELWESVYVHLSLSEQITGMGISTDASIYYDGLLYQHPHSIYLSTAYYGGVIGLVALLAMFGYSLFRMTKLDRSIMIYAIPLFIYGLICLTVDGNRIIRKIDFIWLMIWLPISLSMIRSDSVRRRDS